MRIGTNPQKHSEVLLQHRRHRVIVPVFIPAESGFQAAAFDVFRMSIDSLLRTTGDETRITIVNNASIAKVDDFCRQLLADGRIDRYVANAENRGKAEVVLAAARGSWEEFITVADADILFRHGWVAAAARAFETFPRLGVIGLLTAPAAAYRATSSVILDSVLRLRLRMGRIVPDEVIREFVASTGLEGTKSERRMMETPQFFLNSAHGPYLIGANHAVATYRREVFFADIDKRVTHPFRRKAKLIKHHFDLPSDRLGFWRLCFTRPLAYHMGNTVDEHALQLAAEPATAAPGGEFPETRAKRGLVRFVPFRFRTWLTFGALRLAFRFRRRKDVPAAADGAVA